MRRPASASPLPELDAQQRAAVTAPPGPVLMLAGAGSGKTRTLTHRAAHLARSGALRPEEVLAITFTNRAAEELAARLATLVGSGAAGRMALGTFHAACHRMLRPNAERLGRTTAFSIYDSADARRVLGQALGAEDRDLGLEPAGVARRIALAKARLLRPADLDSGESQRPDPTLARVWTRYEDLLRESNALDFDDLIARTVALLLGDDELRVRVAERFRAVLVDEYQDTSPAQYRWLELLCRGHRNLSVVGDDDQAIYRFRGADLGNLARFASDFPEAKTFALERNYRSSGQIVGAAASLVAHNQRRAPKRPWTDAPQGIAVRALTFANEREEARGVALWCRVLLDRGSHAREVAVLYRTRRQGRPVEAALLEARLPYRLLGGQGLLEHAEIRDALAHLALLVNPRDRVAFARALVTRRGLGPVAVTRIASAAGSRGGDLLEAASRASEVPGLAKGQAETAESFGRTMLSVRAEVGRAGVGALVGEALLASGLPYALGAGREPKREERLERLRDLVRAARAYERSVDAPTLAGFLAHAALVAGTEEAETERICLATIHAAKGLEWDSVRVIGLDEGLFPSRRSMEQGGGEEERRLCYVALTRARRRLCLSHARVRHGRFTGPSRFIAEAGVVLRRAA